MNRRCLICEAVRPGECDREAHDAYYDGLRPISEAIAEFIEEFRAAEDS